MPPADDARFTIAGDPRCGHHHWTAAAMRGAHAGVTGALDWAAHAIVSPSRAFHPQEN